MLSVGLTVLAVGISFLTGRQVKLYVKGAKKAMGAMEEGHYTRETTHVYPIRYWHGYKIEQKTVYEYVLPDEQEKVVELLEEIAPSCGFKVVVIDLGRFSRFGRAFRQRFRGLKVFPTLKASSGRTLTTFAKQDVEVFLLSERPSAYSERRRTIHNLFLINCVIMFALMSYFAVGYVITRFPLFAVIWFGVGLELFCCGVVVYRWRRK